MIQHTLLLFQPHYGMDIHLQMYEKNCDDANTNLIHTFKV